MRERRNPANVKPAKGKKLKEVKTALGKKRTSTVPVPSVPRAEAERLKAAAIDAMPDGLIIVNMDGKITSVNPAFEKMTGYEGSEVVGKDVADVTRKLIKSEEDLEKTIRGLGIALKNKVSTPLTLTLVTRDGREVSIRYYIATASPILDKNNELAAFVHTVKDITEQRRAEDALRKSEERYRGLVETMNEGLEVLDENNLFIYVNDRFCKMLGYSRDKIIGRPITDFVDKSNQNILKEQRARRRKGERGSYEFVWTGKNREKIFTIISAAPILDADSHFKGSFAVTTDITEIKRAEKKIRQVAEEWETTFNSISDLVTIHDKDFKLVRANKAYAEALKMKPEELIGKTCYEVFHGTKEPRPNCPHKQALETKNPTKAEFFEPRLGIHLDVSASPIFDEKGEVVGTVHIAKDITERKKAEEERIKAAADKQQIEELEKFTKIAVGRELKMVELKERIEELASKLKKTTEG